MDIDQTGLRLIYTNNPTAINLALALVERAHPDKQLHNWIFCLLRGEWCARFTIFHLVFKREEFIGYVSLLQCSEGYWWIHFGNLKKNCLKDVMGGFELLKEVAREKGIKEIRCDVDSPLLVKLSKIMGFEDFGGVKIYPINSA